MDDLVRIFGPRARSVLAHEFRRQLSAAGGGESVYAAAVCHADGLAWWSAVNTSSAVVSADDNDVESGAPNPDHGHVHAQDSRWFPDEWATPFVSMSTQTADLIGDLEAWTSDVSHTKSSTWTELKHARVDLLLSAMGSDEVRTVFTAVGADPVLFVFDSDGFARPTVASLETLNRNHSDPALVEEAMTFWRKEA